MRVHFIGVGGYGMSGLAEALKARGHDVSGCDARANRRTERLCTLGVRVAIGHAPDHVEEQDRVVYSTDVPLGSPELARARALAIPVIHRSEILAELLGEGGRSVVVTGTHGKTTTTTLLTHLLAHAGLDPFGIVGGEVEAWGGGVRLGASDVVVAEGDESDGSFLRYAPDVAIVTFLEPEHLEHYGMDFERVVDAYGQFLSQVKPGGAAIVWRGCGRLMSVLGRAGGSVHTYGEEADAYIRACGLEKTARGVSFDVQRDGEGLGRVFVPLHGVHNVRNALAALDAALMLGAPWAALAEGLATFANAHRRFEIIATEGGVTVVDDYAHHPTEIRAVLAAARELGPARIIAVFQPQRYVRTKNLWNEFLAAFDEADTAMLTDIYAPAGEERIPGVSAEALARDVARSHPDCRYAGTLDGALAMVLDAVRPGDLVVTMGAGDVYRVAEGLRDHLSPHGQGGT